MRRWAIAILIGLSVALACASTGTTGDDTPGAPITIEYHGQSFYIITTSKGKRIAFDPHLIAEYYLESEKDKKADIICISHNHNDHTQIGALVNHKEAKILRGLKTA